MKNIKAQFAQQIRDDFNRRPIRYYVQTCVHFTLLGLGVGMALGGLLCTLTGHGR